MMNETDAAEPRKDRHLVLITSGGEVAALPRRDGPSAEVYVLRQEERQVTVKLIRDMGGAGPRGLRTRTPSTNEADVPPLRQGNHPLAGSDVLLRRDQELVIELIETLFADREVARLCLAEPSRPGDGQAPIPIGRGRNPGPNGTT
jgi:hypothetical protein